MTSTDYMLILHESKQVGRDNGTSGISRKQDRFPRYYTLDSEVITLFVEKAFP